MSESAIVTMAMKAIALRAPFGRPAIQSINRAAGGELAMM